MIKFIQNPVVLLLKQNHFHPLVLDTEAAFGDSHFFELPAAQGIPIDAVRNIYKARAEINKDKQCGVQGYDELLDALSTTSEPLITIHSYLTYEAKFSVFSDVDSQELIGILKIPISFQDYLTYIKLATR